MPEALQRDNDELIAQNQALITQLEAQAVEVQEQLRVIRGGTPKNKPKPKPEPINIIPAVTAEYDEAVKEYQDALRDAEDSATRAQIAAMQQGRARIEAERQVDLEQARRAFEVRTEGLKEGGDKYNALLAAFNNETAAINTRANQQLEADADAKLKTAQSLKDKIERVSEDLADAQARGIDNPQKAITGQFQITSRTIARETAALLAEVETALQEGAITAQEATAQVTQINETANGRQLRAEREQSAALKKLREERQAEAVKLAEETAKAVQTTLEAQGDALSAAQVAAVAGSLPQLEAAFKNERELRQRAFSQTFEDFKGTASERAKLVKDFQQTETLLTRQHQLNLNREEKSALEAYLKTVKDFEAQVAQARQQAAQQELANRRALLEARTASAQGQIDSGDTGTQQAGYSALIAVQRDAVTLAREVTQAERERGASASEVVSALRAEAEAQRGVVDAVQGQIDSLKRLREEQLGVINSGSQVLDYARAPPNSPGVTLTNATRARQSQPNSRLSSSFTGRR